MKRAILTMMTLLLLPIAAWSQTTAVSGHLLNPDGSAPANGKVCFTLQGYKPNTPRVVGSGTVIQERNFCVPVSTSNGSYSTNLYGSAALTPANTYWRVDFFNNGIQQSSASYLISGTSYNLDNAAPMTTVPTPAITPTAVSRVFQFTQSPAATTWTVAHNFGTTSVLAQFFDTNGKQIFPDTVTITDANTVTATFVVAQAGTATVMNSTNFSQLPNASSVVVTNPTANQAITGGFNLTTGPQTVNGNLTVSGTGTFANSGVFTNTQMNLPMTSSVNGLNFLTEFQIAQGANTSTDGFASGVNCPVGATVYQCNGISGYVAVNGTSIHAGVAGNFIANCKINNCSVFGANPVAEDVSGLTAGVALTGTEVDTGPQNAVSAYSGLFGVTSAIGGTSTSWTPGTRVSGSAAFKAGSNAIAQNRAWAFGFSTQDLAVTDAAFLSGATCASSGTCNSQGLQFNSYNGGVLKSASITSSNTGSLLATPVSGGFFFMAAGDGFAANEGAAPSCNTSFDAFWGDSGAHRWKMCNNGAAADFVVGDATADTFTAAKTFGTGSSLNFSSLLISPTAPTIAAAGCGGGAASIVVSNGTAAFKVNVGTTPGSACTITMPAATTGWNCFATDITTNSTSVFLQKQTGAESTTSVVLTNFNDVAVATAFVASDILKVSCHAD